MDNISMNIEDIPGLAPTKPIMVSKLNSSESKEVKNEILDPSKYNYQAYWEKSQNESAPQMKPNNSNNNIKPKEVSYDDILSSLNVTVQNGKLQLVNKNKSSQELLMPQPNSRSQRVNNKSNVLQQLKPGPVLKPSTQQQNYIASQNAPQKQVKIDPQLKNSKIYNKYFKDYEQEESPQIPVFETREDYINYQREQYIKQLEQARRITQIKSKKLLFDSPKANIGMSRGNNLRKFSFF